MRRTALRVDTDAIFPSFEPTREGDDPADALARALAQIDGQGLEGEVAVEAVLYVLQRHAWCLPSPLKAVSLADFARTVAAVAAAQAVAPGDMFLLGGDLSGGAGFHLYAQRRRRHQKPTRALVLPPATLRGVRPLLAA